MNRSDMAEKLVADGLQRVIREAEQGSGLPRFMILRMVNDQMKSINSAGGIRTTIAPAREPGA